MKNKKKNRFLCAFERFMYKLSIIIIIGLIILIVCSENALAKKNIEVQNKSHEVEEQKRMNESLNMKIDEMTSLDNIKEISDKYGLHYNSDNIKTIE